MLTGLVRPDAGTAVVAGADVWRDPVAAKARIGVVQDTPALFDRLTGRELLAFHAALRRIDPEVGRSRAQELLQLLDLDDDADRLVVDYSLGMTKKLALAAALLHSPSVLFLDEPFGAIDPVSTNTIERLLGQLVERGGTIIFSSHVIDVVERLCDRVAVMVSGRIAASGRLDDVAARICGSPSAWWGPPAPRSEVWDGLGLRPPEAAPAGKRRRLPARARAGLADARAGAGGGHPGRGLAGVRPGTVAPV